MSKNKLEKTQNGLKRDLCECGGIFIMSGRGIIREKCNKCDKIKRERTFRF